MVPSRSNNKIARLLRSSSSSGVLRPSSSGPRPTGDSFPGEEEENTAGPPLGGGMSMPISRYFLRRLLIHVCRSDEKTNGGLSTDGELHQIPVAELGPILQLETRNPSFNSGRVPLMESRVAARKSCVAVERRGSGGAGRRRRAAPPRRRRLGPGRAPWRLLPAEVVRLRRHVGHLLFPLPLVFFVSGFHRDGEVLTAVSGVRRHHRLRRRLWVFTVRRLVARPKPVPPASLRQGEDLLDAGRLFGGGTGAWRWEGDPLRLLRGGRWRRQRWRRQRRRRLRLRTRGPEADVARGGRLWESEIILARTGEEAEPICGARPLSDDGSGSDCEAGGAARGLGLERGTELRE
ncbi:hypothetical protein EYF80_028752 [Liparis tanakae]|uniref:Uncharacterized protein n=1 Tax=Liparis tanakae TaxID=230148 RepID=A0A4Z2H7Z7_9TELE|nr:hypothetical protein EYF80_028752 [Liparis tanakae]